jgi:hypothetical protein
MKKLLFVGFLIFLLPFTAKAGQVLNAGDIDGGETSPQWSLDRFVTGGSSQDDDCTNSGSNPCRYKVLVEYDKAIVWIWKDNNAYQYKYILINSGIAEDENRVIAPLYTECIGACTDYTGDLRWHIADISIGSIVITGLPYDDETFQFLALDSVNAGETAVQWNTVYLDDTANELMKADANATGKYPVIGLVTDPSGCTDGNSCLILLEGVVRDDDWSWPGEGKALYLDTTAGGISAAIPTDEGACIQKIGWSIDDDNIYFKPDSKCRDWHTECIYMESPTVSDDWKSVWISHQDVTIIRIWAESDQDVTFNFQEDDDSPADIATADLVVSAGVYDACASGCDTTIADSAFAAGSRMDIDLVSVNNTPTWVSMCFSYVQSN